MPGQLINHMPITLSRCSSSWSKSLCGLQTRCLAWVMSQDMVIKSLVISHAWAADQSHAYHFVKMHHFLAKVTLGHNLQLHFCESLFSEKKTVNYISVLSLPCQHKLIKTLVISHAWAADPLHAYHLIMM